MEEDNLGRMNIAREAEEEINLEREIDPQKLENFFEGEFLPADQLKEYILKIQNFNPQIPAIRKNCIKFLQLFFFNDRKKKKEHYRPVEIAYYTMIKRPSKKVEKNHAFKNLRFNSIRNRSSFLELYE